MASPALALGAPVGALFAALGRQKLQQANLAAQQQQLAAQQAVRDAQVREADAGTALKNNRLSGLDAIYGSLTAGGVPPDRAAIMAAAIQANGGANFNTTGQGLGRLFTLGGIGDAAANNTAAGIDNTKVGGGVAFNPTALPTDQQIVPLPAAPGQSAVKYTAMGENLNGLPTYLGSDGKIYQPQNGALGPVSGALPAETQAYVPKVFSALGANPAFDKNGQPTPQLLDAVQQVESGGNPQAVSPKGAQGPYQLMPATAASVGVTNPFDPAQARQGAGKYLAQLYQQFGGDAQKAVAAYNAGPGAVANSGWAKAGARDYQGESAAALMGDPTKSGADYIASIPQGNQELVQGVLDGSVNLPSGTALKSPLWQSVLASVRHADPTWNQGTYQQRVNARKAFTVGKQGDMVRQLQTISQHASQYADDAAALGNGNVTPWNAAKNKVSSMLGDTGPGNLDTDALALSEETSKFLTGGVPAVSTINEWKSQLDSNASHAQQVARMTRILGIVSGQLGSLVQQYRNAVGPLGQPLGIVSPEAAQAFRDITHAAEGMGVKVPAHLAALQTEFAVPTPGGAQAAAPSASVPLPAAPVPTTFAVNPRTGERVQWNGTAWVPAGGGNG